MNYQNYVDDIRARFPGKEYLLADDIAILLSKKPKALRSFLDRGNLPKAKEMRGGRIGVTVGEMAEYLMNAGQTHGRKKTKPKPPKPSGFILKPRMGRESFASIIAQARIQAEFANALANAFEVISLRGQDAPFERESKGL